MGRSRRPRHLKCIEKGPEGDDVTPLDPTSSPTPSRSHPGSSTMRKSILFPLALGLLLTPLALSTSKPETNGVTSNSILLGQSCALKGPAAGLGIGMKEGLTAYFDLQNANGGINGRTIELKTLNDGYEPEKCEKATKLLIDKSKVFMMIGEVGTPTSKVAVPICEDAGVPFIAPFTGAEFLRNPYREQVVNLRGSYYQEMERLAEYLVDDQGLTKISCFYQNDSYGKAGLSGIEKALEKRNMTLTSTGTYERNTTAVAQGVDKIGRAHV